MTCKVKVMLDNRLISRLLIRYLRSTSKVESVKKFSHAIPSEIDAKLALFAHVSTKGYKWADNINATKIEVNKLNHAMAHWLKLESFMESRSICNHARLPLKENAVKNIRQSDIEEENIFDPWTIRFDNAVAIPTFVATEFEIAIPNSETVINCDRCHGTGEIQCVNCITYGAVELLQCSRVCSGTIKQQCKVCCGTGKITALQAVKISFSCKTNYAIANCPDWFKLPKRLHIFENIVCGQFDYCENGQIASHGTGDVRSKCIELLADADKEAAHSGAIIREQRLIEIPFSLTKFTAVLAGEVREFYLYGKEDYHFYTEDENKFFANCAIAWSRRNEGSNKLEDQSNWMRKMN